jgi:hypothetical protein
VNTRLVRPIDYNKTLPQISHSAGGRFLPGYFPDFPPATNQYQIPIRKIVELKFVLITKLVGRVVLNSNLTQATDADRNPDLCSWTDPLAGPSSRPTRTHHNRLHPTHQPETTAAAREEPCARHPSCQACSSAAAAADIDQWAGCRQRSRDQ